MSSARRHAFALVLSAVAVSLSSAAAQDVITVGSVTATGPSVDVPVFIRDTSGTPLGVDRPAGSRIQSYSVTVNYSPSAAVSSVSFTRQGITAGLTPSFEVSPASPGTITLLDTFPEASNPIRFTSNAPMPGDLVAHLVFTLSTSASPGTVISLTLDPSLSQLTDEGGGAATKETVANGTLSLVNGAITLPQLSLSISPQSATVVTGVSTTLTATLSAAGATNTTLMLSSSNPAIASVSSSVVVPAGSRSASFNVAGVSVGSATITATVAGVSASAQASIAVEAAASCGALSVPQISAPQTAEPGASYAVTWSNVTGATEYVLEESTDSGFAVPSGRSFSGTSATFAHSTPNVRYYYRVRAHAAVGSCDTYSSASQSASVLINAAAPGPATHFLAVVGSLPGNLGSFFKTSLQMYNPRSTSCSGKIVYHAAGEPGSASDRSLAYSIPPFRTLVYGDLLPAMGVPSGLGSADVIPDATSALPVALIRVFSDGGAAGTTGFSEEIIGLDTALQQGETGVLIAPVDVQKFRLNVGFRALAQGANIKITVRNRDGVVMKTTARTYPATFFTQVPSEALFDGYALGGGETVSLEIVSGSAIIYGSTTDNATNDPTLEYARRIN